MKPQLPQTKDSAARPDTGDIRSGPGALDGLRRRILEKLEAMNDDHVRRAVSDLAAAASPYRLKALLLEWTVDLAERLGQWIQDTDDEAESRARLHILNDLLSDDVARTDQPNSRAGPGSACPPA